MTDLATKAGADGTLPDDDAVEETDAAAPEAADDAALDETVEAETEDTSHGADETVADDTSEGVADAADEAPDETVPVASDETADEPEAEVPAEPTDPSDDESEATDETEELTEHGAVDEADLAETDEQEPDDAADEVAPEGAEDAVDDTDESAADEVAEPDAEDAADDVEGVDVDTSDDTDLAEAAVLAAVAEPGVESAPVETLSPVDTAATAQLDPGATAQLDPGAPGSDGATFAWAPAEAQKKKRRRALWIGIAAGAAVVALVASSLVLIAPGTSVAGVSVGGLTAGAAADVLQQRLAETTIVLTGDGGEVELTGAELGASIEARALAESAFAEHPMWNPTQWFPESADANVLIDPIAAAAALRAAAPDLYTDPVDATLAFDATAATYVTTPAVPGEGIDVDAVLAALRDAYDAGESRIELEPTLSPVEPTTTTAVAEETAAGLNSLLDNTGFYVSGERTVPIDRAVAASWLTVTRDTDGSFDVAADQAAIQAVVDTLPAAVNRDVVNATVITDSGGNVLRSVVAGTAGRTLGDTGNVASEFAAQLAAGNGVYELPVTVQEPTVTALARRIEVDISEQRTYLFENGNIVNSYAISSGLPGHDTDYGQFRIYAKVRLQNMGDRELIKADYFTPDVPWISYFNGDEALHGAYWHNNFGRRMSHGCVNMPVDVAAFVYEWAPIGTEVWVHA